MKTMSIIGIFWFSLSFICIIIFNQNNLEASAGWGILGMLYAIPFAIVGLIKSNKYSIKKSSSIQDLLILANLKEKGALTEEEFQAKKKDLLEL